MATTHAADHNNYADAINKIEAELGINPSGAAATVAARSVAIENDILWITEAPLNVMDPTYGAVGNASTDDGPAFQAAINAAGATNTPGTIIIPSNEYRIRRELLVPGWVRRLTFEGAGANRIRWDTDLGPGKFAMRISKTGDGVPVGNARGFHLKNVEIWGPNISGFSYGSAVSDMSGVMVDSGNLWEDVTVNGFDHGVWLLGNHNAWYDCSISGKYGLYVGPDLPGYTFTQGDQLFDNVNFERPNIAGIAVHPDQSFVAATFIRCHFFSAPFGILKEGPSGGDSSVCNSVTFINTYWESFGNCLIYSAAANGSMSDVLFIASGPNNKYAAATISAYPDDAMIDVPTIAGVRFIGCTGYDQLGDLALFKASSVHDFFHDSMAGGMYQCFQAGKPAWKLGTTLERNVLFKIGDGYISPFNAYGKCRLYKTGSGGITIGDLCEMHGDHHTVVKFNSGTTDIAVGIAAETRLSTEPVMVMEEGRFLVHVDAVVTVNAMKWVKPDPAHDGCVMEASGPYDTNVIGYAVTGTSVDANLGRSVLVQMRGLARSTMT
jgi:Pectate lyase superfamily protein